MVLVAGPFGHRANIDTGLQAGDAEHGTIGSDDPAGTYTVLGRMR